MPAAPEWADSIRWRIMMKTKFVLGVIGVLLWNAPAAEAGFKGCYERVYDKRYLKQHRKQDIVKIRLQLGVGKGLDGPFELLDRVDAGFRKRPIYQGNLVECKSAGDELKCFIENDGGSFTVTDRGDDSLRIRNDGSMNFGDDEGKFSFDNKGEHREFRLYRVSKSACP
jgi:hypothetical protein